MTNRTISTSQLQDLYARMLLARIVDDGAWRLHAQGYIDFVASCRGYEAAQVGSALCIQVGTDFTLPSYRDLGVVLTIGMTPYEVFRTYLRIPTEHATSAEALEPYVVGQSQHQYLPVQASYDPDSKQRLQGEGRHPAMLHWGYHKHNTVAGPSRTATQILHTAGIAFASKLRKQSVVTVAYCNTDATMEPDFLEGLRFAAQHRLPVVFICEQDSGSQHQEEPLDLAEGSPPPTSISYLKGRTLPEGITHQCIDGSDIIDVYHATQTAMQQAREGNGPVLLEMQVSPLAPDLGENVYTEHHLPLEPHASVCDPLLRCQYLLQKQNAWDEAWARELVIHYRAEIARASRDAQQ